MQCPENRQRDSETQIAQGHDLVQTMSLGDIFFGGQYSDQEKRDARGAHCERRAGDFGERGEND
jgi:hypothetical protein